MDKKVISPCISICKTDPVTGYCYGCARTNEDKKLWKDENTRNEWKEQNLKIIVTRIQGDIIFLSIKELIWLVQSIFLLLSLGELFWRLSNYIL